MVEMNRNRSKETKDIANNIDGLVINQVTLHLYKTLYSEYFQEILKVYKLRLNLYATLLISRFMFFRIKYLITGGKTLKF